MLRQRVLQRLGRLRQEIFYIDKDEMVDSSYSSEQSLPVDAVMFLLKQPSFVEKNKSASCLKRKGYQFLCFLHTNYSCFWDQTV